MPRAGMTKYGLSAMPYERKEDPSSRYKMPHRLRACYGEPGTDVAYLIPGGYYRRDRVPTRSAMRLRPADSESGTNLECLTAKVVLIWVCGTDWKRMALPEIKTASKGEDGTKEKEGGEEGKAEGGVERRKEEEGKREGGEREEGSKASGAEREGEEKERDGEQKETKLSGAVRDFDFRDKVPTGLCECYEMSGTKRA